MSIPALLWENAELRKRIAKLEARVAEMTEWRPMDWDAKCESEILCVNKIGDLALCHWDGAGWEDGSDYYFDPLGWLPLPVPPATPDRKDSDRC